MKVVGSLQHHALLIVLDSAAREDLGAQRLELGIAGVALQRRGPVVSGLIQATRGQLGLRLILCDRRAARDKNRDGDTDQDSEPLHNGAPIQPSYSCRETKPSAAARIPLAALRFLNSAAVDERDFLSLACN